MGKEELKKNCTLEQKIIMINSGLIDEIIYLEKNIQEHQIVCLLLELLKH